MTNQEEIAAFREAWSHKPTRDYAKELAKQYVESRRERLAARYGDLTLEELVTMVDAFRAQGQLDRVTEIDMWLITEFPPQHVGGTADMQVRIVRG